MALSPPPGMQHDGPALLHRGDALFAGHAEEAADPAPASRDDVGLEQLIMRAATSGNDKLLWLRAAGCIAALLRQQQPRCDGDAVLSPEAAATVTAKVVSNMLCQYCGDIMWEPVTCRCGQSSDAACLLMAGSCLQCHATLDELAIRADHPDITLVKALESFWPERQQCLRNLGEAGQSPTVEAIDAIRQTSTIPNWRVYNALMAALIRDNRLDEAIAAGIEALATFPRILPLYQLQHTALCKRAGGAVTTEALAVLIAASRCISDEIFPAFQPLFVEALCDAWQHFGADAEDRDSAASGFAAEVMAIVASVHAASTPLRLLQHMVSDTPTPGCAQEVLECTICCNFFLDPVTVPCGHTFCKDCLCRALDHTPSCPMCRQDLKTVLADNSFFPAKATQRLVEIFYPQDITARREQLRAMLDDFQQELPIFVCTVAFPGMSLPLHVFEPRYRLMMRRCLESSTRSFGMCMPTGEDSYSEYGTLLYIEALELLPDGRSLVQTRGTRRFRILERGSRDGYNTGRVEWVDDNEEQVPDELAQQMRQAVNEALQQGYISPQESGTIPNKIGELPYWLASARRFPEAEQYKLISLTSPSERIRQVLSFNANYTFIPQCVIS